MPDHRASIYVNREGVIGRWAIECFEVFGYTEEEALGRSLDLIVPKGLRSLHWRGFDRAIQREQMKHQFAVIRVPATHKDGSIVAARFTEETLVLGDDGMVAGVRVTVAGRDPEWVAAAYRLMLAIVSIAERVWRFISSLRAGAH